MSVAQVTYQWDDNGKRPVGLCARGSAARWVDRANTLNRIDSTASRNATGKITVRMSHLNDKQQGDRVTNGGVAGPTGKFTASGAVSEKGNVVVYRTEKGPLITLRFVT